MKEHVNECSEICRALTMTHVASAMLGSTTSRRSTSQETTKCVPFSWREGKSNRAWPPALRVDRGAIIYWTHEEAFLVVEFYLKLFPRRQEPQKSSARKCKGACPSAFSSLFPSLSCSPSSSDLCELGLFQSSIPSNSCLLSQGSISPADRTVHLTQRGCARSGSVIYSQKI